MVTLIDADQDAEAGVWHGLRALAPLTRPYWPRLAVAVLLLVVSAACQTASIVIFGRITDVVLTTGDLAALGRYAAGWGALAVFGAAVSFTGGYLTTWIGEHVVLALRDHTFGHVQRSAAHELAQFRQGDLVARLTSDVDAVERLAASGVVEALSGGVSAVLFAVAAFWVRWDLALAVCLLAPLFWFVSRRLSARMAPLTRQERAGNAALTATVAEALDTLTLARLHNREAEQAAQLHQAGRVWLRAGLGQARVSLAYPAVWEIVETACVLAVLAMGAWEIASGKLTIGGLLAFAAFLGYVYPSLQSLGELAVEASAAAAAGERLRRLWRASEPVAAEPVAARTSGDCEIRLEGVSFRYAGPTGVGLCDVSLKIAPGEFVALTGESGSGKSTVAGLLVGLLAPDAGQIWIGGHDASTFAPHAVRELVTLMPQRAILLHRSIAANIAYGCPDATELLITAAAKAAGAHEFITDLPDGYRTIVSDNARTLSGGQVRRIALARALLPNSPVLILDEPTTGIDGVTARSIMASIREMRRTTTTILITHDPMLAAGADRILVITNGRLN